MAGCWQRVRAFLLLSPGASVRWSSGSVHMTTDAKHVKNLAGLSEVKSTTSELPTAAESVMPRRSMESFRVSVRASPRTARATGGKLHGRHSVSARSGELVQSPGGYLHGPGSARVSRWWIRQGYHQSGDPSHCRGARLGRQPQH